MIAVRLATFYGTSFLMMGIHLPFWPIWLESKGLSAEQIGAVVASGFVVKVLANPFVAHQSDRRGERKRLIVLLCILALLSFLLFELAVSFWAILFVNCLFLMFWSPAMPLLESLTMQSASQHDFDYGRVRLWGSITFIVGAVGIGHMLKGGSDDLIYLSIALMMVLTAASAFWLPDIRPSTGPQAQLSFMSILGDRSFILFLLGAALIQASHAVYYGFGTIHWQRAGIDSGVIGWLWAEGVIVEIVLFIFGAKVLSRIGPARLLALAGLAGAIRWTGTGMTTALPALIVLQALHGLTFGAAHLGAMHFIKNRIAPELSATAQSLYSSAVMGLGMGAAMLVSGRLYAAVSGQAYLLMAVMSVAGGIIFYFLRRRTP
jgi:MFS transporter, PPP family, 3-phenylpropionic acid transporter